ncbi:MAG: 2-oxoacid:acceptor oxidoreductase family protein [Anaerovoracaceae bacterium]|jgi:2-oxoglutarate ferredoxin oxidoreductase subunit gamma|nr:2-oxoacid:acceptor oxidoreductase family protein [Anaerovoracaceae bacterium]
MRINVRFAGAGGQGVILSSVLLAKAYGLGENYNISQTQSYGPEARGGACKAEVVISDENIDYMKVDQADVFIAFNQVGYEKYKETVKKNAMVLVNSTLVEGDWDKVGGKVYGIPATEMAEEMEKPFVVNMVMLGALTKLLPKLHYPKVEAEIMGGFSASIAGPNLEAYEKGYRYMEQELVNRTES